jgi:pimeloyl-ACP methyl ester carboxylesterase
MPRSSPVDGFSLAYDRHASGPPVILLHGWPGDRHDWREIVPRLAADVVVPDLRGFGESDKHDADPAAQYSAAGQARSVIGLIDELGLEPPVVCGYDVGSRVAQAIAAERELRALVLAPPLPGAGERVLGPDGHREFWYQHFHRLELPAQIVDGNRDAVRAYLQHFWSHWSGPGYEPEPAELDRLAGAYGAPGAFMASINWYRGGSGMIARSLAETAPDPADRTATPTTVLWPEHDPLFPRAWSDRVGEFFSDVTVTDLPGAGHFSPLESPGAWAEAIAAAAQANGGRGSGG